MHDDAISQSKQRRKKNRGYMFLVDVPTYAAVCDLGDADAAAVYLILAAGTGADNRTSTWSREAVNKRTGLNWRKADACIAKLEKAGLVRWISGKSTRKPRLDLPPIETRKPMQKHVADMAERILYGDQPITAKDKGAATIGKDQGWLAQDDDGTWRFVADRPLVKAWLANALVGDETGKATRTSTIVDRIRMARDPMAFRLLVDLYSLQNLAEHGGVDREHFYQVFEREKAGATSKEQVWRFTNREKYYRSTKALEHHARKPTKEELASGWRADQIGAGFFGAASILQDAGALEWVYYLAEDDKSDSNRVYPVAVERHGKVVWSELESIVGGYAVRAACALSRSKINETMLDAMGWEQAMPTEFLLPADRLAREAALVGVPRLRCRPKTTNTARWRQELHDEAMETIQMFRGIIAEHAPDLLADADRRLADFNEDINAGSTDTSTFVQHDINDSSWSGKHEASVLRTDGEGASPSPRVFHDENDPEPFKTGSTRW